MPVNERPDGSFRQAKDQPARCCSMAPARSEGWVSGAKRAATIRVAHSIRRRALLRRGLPVRVSCPGACKVRATARARGRTVAKARAAGTGTLRATVRPRRRALGATRKIALKVTVHAEGAAPRVVRRAVRVR